MRIYALRVFVHVMQSGSPIRPAVQYGGIYETAERLTRRYTRYALTLGFCRARQRHP